MKYIILFFLIITPFVNFSQNLQIGQIFSGKASYYGAEFTGRRTSSGEILKLGEFTCAHKTLPFGTMLEVENPVTKKWVIVKVNDRGPFTKSRVIDLSIAAAKKIDMISKGIISINAMIVGYKGDIIIHRPDDLTNNIDNIMPDSINKPANIPFKND